MNLIEVLKQISEEEIKPIKYFVSQSVYDKLDNDLKSRVEVIKKLK